MDENYFKFGAKKILGSIWLVRLIMHLFFSPQASASADLSDLDIQDTASHTMTLHTGYLYIQKSSLQ